MSSRSSGAAWSMAARRHFRRGDADLPSRGSFQHRGSQVVTGAEARTLAAEEAARERLFRDRPGSVPEPRQAFHHPPVADPSSQAEPVPQRPVAPRTPAQPVGPTPAQPVTPPSPSPHPPRRSSRAALAGAGVAAGPALLAVAAGGALDDGVQPAHLVLVTAAAAAGAIIGRAVARHRQGAPR
jgi:hypothetical protein